MLVKCMVCDLEISHRRIINHVTARHKEILPEEYINKYYKTLPNYNMCKVCNNNIVKGYKTCSKECHSTLRSDISKNVPKPAGFMDVKHKEKLSKSRLKYYETHEGSFTGHKHSKETNQMFRENCIKNKPHKGHKQSDYQKSQARKSRLKYYAEGNEPWTKNNKHTPETIAKIISHRPMNKLEKLVSEVLNLNKIPYYYQFFINNNDIIKSYDFKLKGKNIIIEIDGDYYHGGPSLDKHFFKLEETQQNDIIKTKLAEDNGYSIIRIWESEIKSNPNIIIDRINELYKKNINGCQYSNK
jgi:very-short-patch-repair endonuclease